MPCVACTYMPNASWRRRGGKAQGRGISHPEQRGGRAERRSAQAQRGRLLGNPCAAPGQRPQRGLVSLCVRASAHDFQGRVAAGTGRRGGKRRTHSGRSAGRRLPPAKVETIRFIEAAFCWGLPTPGGCSKMDTGRVRTVLECRNSDRQMGAAGRSKLLPRPFSVGEPVAYVQAPKAKGHRSLSIGFRTPRLRVYRAVCGGVPQTFSEPRRSNPCSLLKLD